MLSHDVSSGPECYKPVTIFKSCENSGCADVLLTRRAANKEVQYDGLVKSQQERVDAAMVREWDKWNEFGVTKFLSKKQLNDIMKRNPDQKIVGTRWVFTEKTIQGKPDYKTRLVVQGCQEDKGYIRNDAHHWIARRLLHDTFSSISKRLGLQCVRCPVSVPPVRWHQETVVVADASQKSASWDEPRATVCCYWFDLRDERCWTSTARRCLRQLVLWSQGWNKVSTTCMGPSGLEALVHTHVDDFSV